MGKLPIIVDLAVKRDPDGLVFVGQGLSTSLQVDDAETPMTQTNRAVTMQAGPVRSPVGQRVAHAGNPVGLDRAVTLAVGNSADPAHAGRH